MLYSHFINFGIQICTLGTDIKYVLRLGKQYLAKSKLLCPLLFDRKTLIVFGADFTTGIFSVVNFCGISCLEM